MCENIDLTDVLGVNRDRKGVGTSEASVYSFTRNVKLQHRRKVALVQVGEFYEAIGYDAVVLVEHAGFNPMGPGARIFHPIFFQSPPSLSPPRPSAPPTPAETVAFRAGFPLANLGRTLDKLRAAGFSSVVCNEAPQAAAYGSKRDRKERFVLGVDTPKSPLQLGQVMDPRADFRTDDPGPILAVSADSLGFRLVEVDVISRRAIVRENISEEAVRSRVEAEGAWAYTALLGSLPLAAAGRPRRASSRTLTPRLAPAAAAAARPERARVRGVHPRQRGLPRGLQAEQQPPEGRVPPRRGAAAAHGARRPEALRRRSLAIAPRRHPEEPRAAGNSGF